MKTSQFKGKGSRPAPKTNKPEFRRLCEKDKDTHFSYNMTVLVGCSAEVTTRSGEKYEGIFVAYSSTQEIMLEAAHLITNENEESNISTHYDVLIIPSDKLMTMKFENAALGYATREFQTDTAISSNRSTAVTNKELTPWDGGEGDVMDGDLDLGEATNGTNGWAPGEMFKKNAEKYGVTTSYDQQLSGYTTSLDKTDSESFKKHEEQASQIAEEIERSSISVKRTSAENGEDEEEKFSAVIRDSSYSTNPSLNNNNNTVNSGKQISSGRYVPPFQRRNRNFPPPPNSKPSNNPQPSPNLQSINTKPSNPQLSSFQQPNPKTSNSPPVNIKSSNPPPQPLNPQQPPPPNPKPSNIQIQPTNPQTTNPQPPTPNNPQPQPVVNPKTTPPQSSNSPQQTTPSTPSSTSSQSSDSKSKPFTFNVNAKEFNPTAKSFNPRSPATPPRPPSTPASTPQLIPVLQGHPPYSHMSQAAIYLAPAPQFPQTISPGANQSLSGNNMPPQRHMNPHRKSMGVSQRGDGQPSAIPVQPGPLPLLTQASLQSNGPHPPFTYTIPHQQHGYQQVRIHPPPVVPMYNPDGSADGNQVHMGPLHFIHPGTPTSGHLSNAPTVNVSGQNSVLSGSPHGYTQSGGGHAPQQHHMAYPQFVGLPVVGYQHQMPRYYD